MELVSIIIPTYKNRGTLEKSIQSCLDQTYTNIEIIIVDDNGLGSPKQVETQTIIEKFKDYPNLKYIVHDINKNGAAARNTGIKSANGEFIAFLDDDDCFLPNKITQQLHFLKTHSQFDAAYCLASRQNKPIETIPYEGDVSYELLLGKSSIFTPTMFFKKEMLINIGGFDESFRRHQDYELLLRFFAKGYRIGCLTEILTDLGTNEGENIPHGEQLENLKKHFLNNFSSQIDTLEEKHPGARNRITASHYSKVFIDHIKTHNWKLAIRILQKYFFKNPSIFIIQIYKTALHIIFHK